MIYRTRVTTQARTSVAHSVTQSVQIVRLPTRPPVVSITFANLDYNYRLTQHFQYNRWGKKKKENKYERGIFLLSSRLPGPL